VAGTVLGRKRAVARCVVFKAGVGRAAAAWGGIAPTARRPASAMDGAREL